MSDSKGTTLDLKSALEYAKNWRNSKDYKHAALHGFHVPVFDLEAVLGEGVNGVRFYLGIDDKGEAKIMLVGTIWNPDTLLFDDMLPEMEHTGNIYDFSMPCPKACSTKSPFNDIK